MKKRYYLNNLLVISLMLFSLVITPVSAAVYNLTKISISAAMQETDYSDSEIGELSQKNKRVSVEADEISGDEVSGDGVSEDEVTEEESPQGEQEEINEPTGVVYDPQPVTREEVQVWIDLFTTTLAESGLQAALNTKPHWQYAVGQNLMPNSYHCELVDYDENFGAEYYSFFMGAVTTDSLSVSTADGLYNAIANMGSVTDRTITITQNINLDALTDRVIPLNSGGDHGSAKAPLIIPKGKNITIIGNNFTLTKSKLAETNMSYRHFGVCGSLTLQNVTLFGNGKGGGVQVIQGSSTTAGGTFIMKTGAVINGAYAYIFGGGVQVEAYARFNMEGGSIIGSTSVNYGGGVYVVNGGALSMTGGEIGSSGNPNKALDGGGIFLGGGTFTMNAGSVQYNRATDGNGGGINVSAGTFTMNGGIFRGNIVDSNIKGGGGISITGGLFEMYYGEIFENTSAVGGGVLITTQSSNFIMYDGLIHDNIQNYTGTYGGGGLYVDNGECTMKGGKIYNNSADNTGGGVRVTVNGKFTMDGPTASITGNTTKIDGGGVYVNNGGTFTFKNGLIDKNTAANNGGGVCLNNGSGVSAFLMTGGTLSGNIANKHGGGVYVNDGTFNMTGGSVSYNIATSGNGGGVYLPAGGTMTVGMTAATCNITDNKAYSGHGGGIYAATFENNYAGLTVGQKAFFTRNAASVNYRPPFDDENVIWTNINNVTSSLDVSIHPANHLNPVNNNDINVQAFVVQYYINGVLKSDWKVTVAANSKIFNPSGIDDWHRGSIGGVKWNYSSDRLTSNTNLYTAIQTNFAFTKVDAGNPDQSLSDATFNLYKWVGSGSAPNQLVPQNLQGSGWALIGTYTSDVDGYFDLGTLEYDVVYQLAEIKAPTGYQLPMGQWRITVNADKTLAFDTMGTSKPLAFENIGTKEAPIYLLPNMHQYELPLTGGQEAIWFTIMGGLILTSCAGWFGFRRKSGSRS